TLFALNHYQISRDENNFPDANKFLPKRWLRDNKIIKKYEIRPDPKGVEVSAMARIVLTPNRPINLQFLNRASSKST
ncbi:hypothetical protein AB205_0162110, partial [Aquarana catesbeiana]